MSKWLQKGQGMWGCGKEDHTTDIGNTLNGCGEWSNMKAEKPKEDEGISQTKLGGIRMMGKWMETIT